MNGLDQYGELLMGKGEVAYVMSKLQPTDVMLEWGSGGSTYTFSPLVKRYCSIEHDAPWANRVTELLANVGVDNVDLRHVPINSHTKTDVYLDRNAERVFRLYEHIKTEFGISYALTRGVGIDWHCYIDYINGIKLFDEKFDKIFIDGRVRPMCAVMAMDYLKDDGIVFIHDYGGRVKYSTVLDHYEIIDEVEGGWACSMVVLRKL